MSDREISLSRSGSPLSPGEARSPARHRSHSNKPRSRTPSPRKSNGRKSRSRSRTPRRSRHSRSRERDYYEHHDRRHSRSRTRSPYRSNRRSRYSRSRSRSPYYRDSRRYDNRDDRRGGRRSGRSRSRSPMSSRRRHQGNRENPKENRCLGVFGLSLRTQERDLREIFERYGPIDDLQIVYDHQTGRSRGFAFLYMRNTDDAAEAKEHAPGIEIDGRPIRVDFSITERAHTPTPGIYLGKPAADEKFASSRSSGGRGWDSGRGGGSRRRSPSPYYERRRGHSRSRSYSPRRY